MATDSTSFPSISQPLINKNVDAENSGLPDNGSNPRRQSSSNLDLWEEQNGKGGVSKQGSWRRLKLTRSSRTLSANRQDSQWKFKHEQFWDSQPDLESTSSRNLGDGQREYYQRQKTLLEGYRQVDEMTGRTESTESEKGQQEAVADEEMFAVQVSNWANVVLFLGKLYIAVASGSLAVIASTLDSLLDLAAGGILWLAALSMQSPDKYKYPAGTQRMQPVGIVVFAAIMATLGVQVLLEGIRQLLDAGSRGAEISHSDLILVTAVLTSVTAVKLWLYLYCRRIDNDIVQAYAKDHLFDVLTNAVSMVAVILASQLAWWIDPAGAILISLYTIVNWSGTVLENALSLVGTSASPEIISKLTYMALNHDKRIVGIDTVRAWSFGSAHMAEVDIELPEFMSLREAHDIGESLQNKIEALPEFDRAFVHLDYESVHKPEHSQS